MIGQQGMDMMKDKMADLMKSFGTSNTQTTGLNQQSINQGIGQGIGQVIGQQGLDAAKQKMNEFMNSFKQSAAPPPQQPQQQQQMTQAGQQDIGSGIKQGIEQVISQQGLNVAKEKMNELMNSFKQSASDTYNRAQIAVNEPANSKKVEQQVSNIFSGAFSKLKNVFSSKKPQNADDLTKQEAIKAFDDFADRQPTINNQRARR